MNCIRTNLTVATYLSNHKNRSYIMSLERRQQMKLLFCPQCNDVKKLDTGITYCRCKASFGYYLNDGLNAEIGGVGKVIGLANSDIGEAIMRPDHSTIRCWMMNDSAPHIKRIIS